MLSNAYLIVKFRLIQPRTSPPKMCKILQYEKCYFAYVASGLGPRGLPVGRGHDEEVPERAHAVHVGRVAGRPREREVAGGAGGEGEAGLRSELKR